MAAHEESSDRAKIIAAGYAAASWARARRAAWTDAPIVIAQPPVEAAPEPEPPPPPTTPSGPPLSERAGEWLEAAREPVTHWGPRIAAAAALAAVAIFGGPYVYRMLSASKARLTSSPPQAVNAAPTPAPAKNTGTVTVHSTPDGARVLLDGAPRGTTPLTLNDVPLGRHIVVLESAAGSIERSITVSANAPTEVEESIFSGFVTIFSPFELTVTEGTRALRPDDRNEIMLPAGRHDLRLSNRTLGFEEVRRIDLKPGQKATISIAPPTSSVSVTASEAAEVWIDGARLGDAPVANAPVDLGTHEVIVRRSAGGERRFTITATVKPVVLNVDFSR